VDGVCGWFVWPYQKNRKGKEGRRRDRGCRRLSNAPRITTWQGTVIGWCLLVLPRKMVADLADVIASHQRQNWREGEHAHAKRKDDDVKKGIHAVTIASPKGRQRCSPTDTISKNAQGVLIGGWDPLTGECALNGCNGRMQNATSQKKHSERRYVSF